MADLEVKKRLKQTAVLNLKRELSKVLTDIAEESKQERPQTTRNHHNAQNLVLAERVLVMEKNINHKSIKRRTLVYDRAGRPSHRTMSPPNVVVGLQWNGLSSRATSKGKIMY